MTPLGDPPLFVGFLRGIDFFWPARHLWLQTVIVALPVLAMFLAVDCWFYRREAHAEISEPPRSQSTAPSISS